MDSVACFENTPGARTQVGALRRSAQLSAAARRTRLAPASSLFSCAWVRTPRMSYCHRIGTTRAASRPASLAPIRLYADESEVMFAAHGIPRCSPRPAHTPAASFKSPYRKCSGPGAAPNPIFACRSTADRDLRTFATVSDSRAAGCPVSENRHSFCSSRSNIARRDAPAVAGSIVTS